MTILSATSASMCDSNDTRPPTLRSQLSSDLASVGGTSDDLSVSRDIFDFDEFFLQPAVKLLEETKQPQLPKRSVSFLDPRSAASSSLKPHGVSPSLSMANFRFGRSAAGAQHRGSSGGANNATFLGIGTRPNSTAGSGSLIHKSLNETHQAATNATNTTVSANPFSRSMSVRNVSDLKRTRDKLLGGGAGGSAHTPFYALKNLARQRAADAAARGSATHNRITASSASAGSNRVQVASVLRLPSNVLLDAVRNNGSTGGVKGPETPSSLVDSTISGTGPGGPTPLFDVVAPKRMRVSESALHRACCRPGVSTMEIYQLLQRNPGAASRSEILHTSKLAYDHGLNRRVEKLVKEPYTLPLNLAIAHRQSSQVLDILMNVSPSVLTMRDGKEREGPLSILLKYSPQDTDTVDRMLLLSPKCVALRDRNGNTPAHVACTRHASLDAVRHICIMYPESLRMKNSHGHIPLRLAELYTRSCSEAVCTFLWDQQHQLLQNGSGTCAK